MRREIRLHRDHEHLTESVAGALEHDIGACIAARGICHLVLAGGQTPLPLFDLLADAYREKISWDRVHLFWGDERYLPYESPHSNYGVARDRLIRHLPIPAENVHPMPTDADNAEEDAAAYERLLRPLLGPRPRFDLILLGLGVDGHTASLFPDSRALIERRRWIMAVDSPVLPPKRLTMTLRLINGARNVHFLVVGRDKAEALQCAFGQRRESQPCPAKAVEPSRGNVIWWVDATAAEGL